MSKHQANPTDAGASRQALAGPWQMLDFTVSFLEGHRGVTLVHAATGGHGETPPPLDRLPLKELEQIASAAGRLARKPVQEAQVERLGRRLGAAILSGSVRRLYDQVRGSVQRDRQLLRVLLQLGSHSSLQRVPWEILHDGQRFLAGDPSSAVVRSFEQELFRGPLVVEPPLRVLLTTGNPPGSVRLDLEAEEEALRLAYAGAGSRVELVVRRRISRQQLQDSLVEARRAHAPFHVWHHCGHGHLGSPGGEFALSLEDGRYTQYATVPQLRDVLSVGPELRVAVLNCCYGGSLTGLAPELARLPVPVVIAFPRTIADDSALRFAATLHQCWLDFPIEIAASLARLAMRPGTFDLSQPLLFSRRNDSGALLPPAPAAVGILPPAPGPAAVPTPGERVQPAGDIDFVITGGTAHVKHIGDQDIGTGGPPSGNRSAIRYRQEGGVAHIGSIGFARIGTLSGPAAQAYEERFGNLMQQLSRYLARRR